MALKVSMVLGCSIELIACVCFSRHTVLFTCRRSAHPVSVLILPPEEIQVKALLSPKKRHRDKYQVHRNAVRRLDNAMSSVVLTVLTAVLIVFTYFVKHVDSSVDHAAVS